MSFAVEVDQFCKEWEDMSTKLGKKLYLLWLIITFWVNFGDFNLLCYQ